MVKLQHLRHHLHLLESVSFSVAGAAALAGVTVRQFLKPQPKKTRAAPADALLLFYLADYHIPCATAFVDMVRAATAAAQSGQLVTFGVQPRLPSTAYGNI